MSEVQGEPPQGASWRADAGGVLELLASAEITACELMPWGSNYTFLAKLRHDEGGEGLGVYKPRKGEAPLWDFPDGTLYRREYGAYLVSEAIGWGFIPPSVIRDGPHGEGVLELFIPSYRGANYFTFKDEADRTEALQRMAVFDFFTNNADRKAGHCLLGVDGRVWGIDHGLCFNAVYKLRTVIWEWRSLPIPPGILSDVAAFLDELEKVGPAAAALSELIDAQEMHVLRGRVREVLETGTFPEPGARRSFPWPPV